MDIIDLSIISMIVYLLHRGLLLLGNLRNTISIGYYTPARAISGLLTLSPSGAIDKGKVYINKSNIAQAWVSVITCLFHIAN